MRPPFPRWREGGVSSNRRRREQARELDDGTRVSRRHRTLVLVTRSGAGPRPRPGPGPDLRVHPIFHSSFDRPLTS